MCVRVCVRACVRARVCVYVRVCVYIRAASIICINSLLYFILNYWLFFFKNEIKLVVLNSYFMLLIWKIDNQI